LIDDKNVYQNVALPLKYQKRKKSEIRKKVTETLRYFEIESKIKSYPNQLSGGQKQRVAIARAVVKESEIILADEPTGALDEENGRNVMKVLKELNESGKTVIIVTHDNKIAGQCNRIIEIRDGEIVDENKK
jgi:ABC transporter